MTAPTELRLEGELTIYRAGELRQTLVAALAAATALRIDLADVSEIDSAGLQLLIAAKKDAAGRGLALALANHSHAVAAAIELYDLAAFFGDPLLVAGSGADPARRERPQR